MAHGWIVGTAGYRAFYLPGCGAGGSSLQVRGHPTSMYDTGDNIVDYSCELKYAHVLFTDVMRYDEMEFDEESEPEVPIYNRAELIERYQVMIRSLSFQVLLTLKKQNNQLLTSFLLITAFQFNIFKDMYPHNLCHLL